MPDGDILAPAVPWITGTPGSGQRCRAGWLPGDAIKHFRLACPSRWRSLRRRDEPLKVDDDIAQLQALPKNDSGAGEDHYRPDRPARRSEMVCGLRHVSPADAGTVEAFTRRWRRRKSGGARPLANPAAELHEASKNDLAAAAPPLRLR